MSFAEGPFSYTRPGREHLPLPRAARNGEVVFCNDYLALSPFTEVQQRAAELGVHGVAALPLRLDGRVWGAVLLHTPVPDWFTPDRQQLLLAMADDLQLALALEQRETQRKQALQAVAERDRQVAGIVETAMDAVITIDDSQRILVFNAAAGRIFGIPPATAIGQTIERFLPAAAREAHARHVATFARDGAASAHRMGGERQLTALRADGTEFPIEASIARHDAGGKVLMTVILRDTTDAARAEGERRARVAAEAANAAKNVFLANVSHEIRTPIHGILGYAQLLERTGLGEKQADYVRKLHASADALLRTVDQVLDLSNLEAGKLDIEEQEFDIAQVLSAVEAMVGVRARAKGLAFTLAASPAIPPRMVGDARRITQVLLNLGGNAVKFTREGTVSIELACEPGEGGLVLRGVIRDSGIGIPPEQLQRLFVPFMQADASHARRFEGTGLGLAICRMLVEMMGGTIEATSQPGKGSEFRFSVRVKAAPGLPETPAETAPPAALPTWRVLVVDDNPFNQEVAVVLLTEVGQWRADSAGSGPEALDRLSAEAFDAVLMDVQMPGMDGYETARRIRANPRWDGMPVVAMTAHVHPGVREECMAAGMDDVISKPFEMSQLQALLGRLIGGRTGAAP